jgi:hypothetical protein
MTYRSLSVVVAILAIALSGPVARAQAPKEVTIAKNKVVILANFTSAPNNCATNPGASPLPRLREKPSHGTVGLQIIMSDVAATDACPARKIPSIALFYAPNKDFVGKDSVQVEFEAGDKTNNLSILITVQEVDGK